MHDLSLTTYPYRGCTVVTLDGELDLHTARGLRDEFLRVCARPGAQILLDVTRMRFCDAAGLDLLLAAHHHITGAGGSLTLVGPRRAVSKVLAITELDTYFDIVPSLAVVIGHYADEARAPTEHGWGGEHIGGAEPVPKLPNFGQQHRPGAEV